MKRKMVQGEFFITTPRGPTWLDDLVEAIGDGVYSHRALILKMNVIAKARGERNAYEIGHPGVAAATCYRKKDDGQGPVKLRTICPELDMKGGGE